MESDTLRKEQELIQNQIKMYGYESLYNLTTWDQLKEWKRTCLHCGCIVDPRNKEWLTSFEEQHFENCNKNFINIKSIKTKTKTKKRSPALVKLNRGLITPAEYKQLIKNL